MKTLTGKERAVEEQNAYQAYEAKREFWALA